MAKSTLRVFACWGALYDDLSAATWTPHPSTGDRPLVDFGLPLEFAGEAIVVPGKVPARSQAQWATQGSPGQNETFRLLVGVTTRVSGTTAVEARVRLEELCDIVQSTVRNQATGQPDGAHLQALAVPTMRWIVASVDPAIYPWQDGFAGDATFEIEFATRI